MTSFFNFDLETGIKQLNDELDNYSFDVSHLNHNQREDVENLYKILYSVQNNKIILEKIKNSKIFISDSLFISGIKVNKLNIDKCRTIYIDACNNLEIIVKNKINHLTIYNCFDVTIIVYSNIISGIDIINSKNISFKFINCSFNFADYSSSINCDLCVISRNIDSNVVSLYATDEIRFITNQNNMLSKY